MHSWGSRSFVSLIVFIAVLVVLSLSVQAQISGSSRLDVAAFPIPCTVVDEIMLNTPCERTLLAFDIESILSLNITLSGMVAKIDSAIGIAGPEHLILQGIFNLGAVTIHPEIWFAVPFETVLDVNNQINVVVIPPGEVLFVKKRFATTFNIAGITVNNLAMFEDVNFPNPNADFAPLFYPPQSQSFAFGDIITISGQTISGINITSTTGICATRQTNSVKKFSASGSVNPACADPLVPLAFDFQTITLSGISFGDLQFGANANFVPNVGVQVGSGFNTSIFNMATLFTNFSLSSASATSLSATSGLSVAIVSDLININLNLDQQFQLTSANLSIAGTQTMGPTRISVSGRAALSKDIGLSSISAMMSLTQGTFSANQSVTFTRQQVGTDAMGDPIFGLTFGSLVTNVSLRFAPASITMNVAFGKSGLTRFAIITGVVF